MVDVTLFSFAKRENSTKTPAGGTAMQCRLWGGFTLLSPNLHFVFDSNETNPTRYNYVHIPEFSRYYFINNWEYINRAWIAQCKVDVLASWRSWIGSSRQYVIRSSAKYDGNIIDTLYPTTANVKLVTNGAFDMGGEMPGGNPFQNQLQNGTYIVGIVNDDPGGMGAANYYALTNSQFGALRGALMGSPSYLGNIEEISQELLKALFNPFQYIVSCMWVPFAVGGGGSSIRVGWWDMGVGGSKLTQTTRLASAGFNIPKHPQSGERGNFLNLSPFSRYTLDWPVFGSIPIDPAKLVGATQISAQCFVDLISGKGTLKILPNNGAIVASVNVQVGVPIQMAQMATDYLGSASTGIGAIANAFTGNFLGALSNVGNMASNMMPQLSTSGSNGSISPFMFPPNLACEFLSVVDDDVPHRGRPLCQDLVISSIPGFVVVEDADINFPGSPVEQTQVKNYMESGFYYE